MNVFDTSDKICIKISVSFFFLDVMVPKLAPHCGKIGAKMPVSQEFFQQGCCDCKNLPKLQFSLFV